MSFCQGYRYEMDLPRAEGGFCQLFVVRGPLQKEKKSAKRYRLALH